jgi:hypothetical protein
MAGRKRRKPDGVAGFLTGAVSNRQKVQAQTQRLEARAQLAWAKENAKTATANAREKARQEQREAREQEIAEGHAEAETVTRTLQANLTELRTLLTGTLVLAATLFAHEPAGFDVHVPAGLGDDVLGLGRPGEAGEQACWRARVRPARALRGSGSGRAVAGVTGLR